MALPYRTATGTELEEKRTLVKIHEKQKEEVMEMIYCHKTEELQLLENRKSEMK